MPKRFKIIYKNGRKSDIYIVYELKFLLEYLLTQPEQCKQIKSISEANERGIFNIDFIVD